MLGGRYIIGKNSRDEAEKPFWISFSDLMSALMVLFLVVMTVSLLSVTRKIQDMEQGQMERSAALCRIVTQLELAADKYKDVTINHSKNCDYVVIDFGAIARFALNDYHIAPEGIDRLRQFVPTILEIKASTDGDRWLKQVIVQGFTDTSGTYLHNLNLSLMRAQSVVCSLMPPVLDTGSLSEDQMQQVRRLFLVGGFSSNSSLNSPAESRRVELRLDFRALGENIERHSDDVVALGRC